MNPSLKQSLAFLCTLAFVTVRFSLSWKVVIVPAISYVLYVLTKYVGWLFWSNAPNPFEEDCRKSRRPYISDSKTRDAVLKQGFRPNKVLDKTWDAIVIGSGIGGMTTAAILSKIGKRVLVLEQHDQAGGCCHTYIDKGGLQNADLTAHKMHTCYLYLYVVYLYHGKTQNI